MIGKKKTRTESGFIWLRLKFWYYVPRVVGSHWLFQGLDNWFYIAFLALDSDFFRSIKGYWIFILTQDYYSLKGRAIFESEYLTK